jgi:hypothetical protein
MKIIIETIPHNQQRYETCGDWWVDPDGTIQIRVSNLKVTGESGEFCVGLHEMVEVFLALKRGVTVQQVDDFDKAFEAERERKIANAKTEAEKEMLLIDEPGDDPACPIVKEHNLASGIERTVACFVGIFLK